MWSVVEGMSKLLQNPCVENPMNSVRRQKDRTLTEECPRIGGVQYATGKE